MDEETDEAEGVTGGDEAAVAASSTGTATRRMKMKLSDARPPPKGMTELVRRAARTRNVQAIAGSDTMTEAMLMRVRSVMVASLPWAGRMARRVRAVLAREGFSRGDRGRWGGGAVCGRDGRHRPGRRDAC